MVNLSVRKLDLWQAKCPGPVRSFLAAWFSPMAENRIRFDIVDNNPANTGEHQEFAFDGFRFTKGMMGFLYFNTLAAYVGSDGMGFLPAVVIALPARFDRACACSKTLGLLAVGYLAWLLPATRLIPFTNFTVALSLVIVGVINYFCLPGRSQFFRQLAA